MQIDYKNIKKQFEKSMTDYDKNAVVQSLIADKMIIELTKISRSFDNILELGSGTGLLTRKIAKNIIFKEFYANDLVEKSQFYVKKYIPDSNFLYGNALKIKSSRKMDLIISNAMFQWFENLEKSISIIKNNLEKDGLLVFSSFTPDNFKEIRDITGLTLNYKSKSEIETSIRNLNLELLYIEEFYEEMTFENPLALLAHLKKTGVNSLSEKTWTVKKIKDFCDKFGKKYPITKLTYSPIIIIAKNK